MVEWQRATLTGGDALAAVSGILQRHRLLHPTAGRFEAADLQWWWRTARSTDEVEQLIWVDEVGPVAAAYLTDWSDSIGLDVLVPVDVSAIATAMVLDTGLRHSASLGIDTVELEVARSDQPMRALLADRGFEVTDAGVVECWMHADDRPDVGGLATGYRLVDRATTRPRPSHWLRRNGPDVERRLAETSLYRADLDLVVLDERDEPAAYGLFWYDPVTRTGLVEPMRTEDVHQRRGLARHVLTAGVERLAQAGSERIKICFEDANTVARGLYLDVGFERVTDTDVWAGPTARE